MRQLEIKSLNLKSRFSWMHYNKNLTTNTGGGDVMVFSFKGIKKIKDLKE